MREKPSVLMVVTQGAWGGAQRYIYDLATELADSFYITVAVGEPQGAKDLQAKLLIWNAERGIAGVEVIQLNHLKRAVSPTEDYAAVKELRALYQKLSPDIVHLNSSKAGVVGALAKTGVTPKIVYTVHGFVFNEPVGLIRQTFYKILEQTSAAKKDAIIVLSKEDQQTARKIGLPPSKIKLIPLGLGTPNFLPRLASREKILKLLPITAREKPFWFGTVANSFKTKGLDVLIKAANDQSLKDQAAIIIIGDGPEQENLKKLVRENNLTNSVFFTGVINEAAELLKAFDVMVLPSRKEGLPYAILEALAVPLPVIATTVGGVPSLIENKKSGLQVRPDSVIELREALKWSITHTREITPKENSGHPLEEMLKATSSLYSTLQLPR